MRFAICNELFQGWAHRRVVEFVAATDYEGLEIALFSQSCRLPPCVGGHSRVGHYFPLRPAPGMSGYTASESYSHFSV